ncbi:DUF4126 family protein [Xanthomonas campestris]|uniref:DUF4126 family protein n=1 Tax=Xanthomonas campestris TaxID=339 RepID=UPI00096DE35C|nr:DUF4126 family protein [Xanthomonas campestris]MCF8828189.1 DUF4126 domain-containing protein [Xanthomonas campestris pv. raphani]MEA9712404.1 DUF4126 family protein [Xanthomonas campestris]MEA9746789.1 DUF4126 family protein [Xanthomonas campestris pv. raphani]MEA9784720.1 DUF4126 family protein [Xanthomonas campestris pv. raphani]MEA9793177.1 DUF4126 family protein [Xanthomonas campestris pv. raphani]
MDLLPAALLLGVVAGLRAMLASALLSWAAALGHVQLAGTPLGWLGWRYTPWVVSLLALGELITDQLPNTPSRKVPVQFLTRLLSGALCGGAIGLQAGQWMLGAAAGTIGAVLGTYGGAAARAAVAQRLGRDRPAGLLEDGIALLLGGVALVLLP